MMEKYNIRDFKSLLAAEKDVENHIELTKLEFKHDFENRFKIKSIQAALEQFFTSKVTGSTSIQSSSLQHQLISLSIDFIYEQVMSLLVDKDSDSKSIDWKVVAKSVADQYYIANKEVIIGYISDFIDDKIKSKIRQ